jgi:steroid delta-isomerase-like uncharacterized protein
MAAGGKALVRRWFDEVWNSGRASAIDELMAPHCVIHGLGPAGMSPSDFKMFHAAYRNAFPDVNITIDQVVAEGDLVSACWSGTGTHRGDGLGFPATDKRVRFAGMMMARVADGKLVEGWNSFDQFGMLQQIGVIPMST